MAESQADLVKSLVDAGVHFGHRVSRWNPKMEPYIRGKRNMIHIIDVRETIKGLLRANGYSLVATLGASTADARSNGPGAFNGPYVGGAQALLVLALDLAIFAAIAATLLRRRDVA